MSRDPRKDRAAKKRRRRRQERWEEMQSLLAYDGPPPEWGARPVGEWSTMAMTRGGNVVDGVLLPVEYQCPKCGRFYRASKDGKLWSHRAGFSRVTCPGSGLDVASLAPRLDDAPIARTFSVRAAMDKHARKLGKASADLTDEEAREAVRLEAKRTVRP